LTDAEAAPPWGLVWLLAISAGVSVASMYYAQPLLPLMAAELSAPARVMGWIPTLTQLGMATGFLLLLPIGDIVERRALLVSIALASALMLGAVAAAPTIATLAIASYLLGVSAILPQVVVPFSAGLVGPLHRSKVVGTVLSGLMIGILAARPVAGVLGAHVGWRMVYRCAALALVAVAAVLRLSLPAQRPTAQMRYGELLRSMGRLLAREPVLRRHALLGATTFACFSVFWTTLAFHLAGPPHHYGSDVAGGFGVVGIAGAMAAPVVGGLADRFGPVVVNGTAVALVLAAFVIFGVSGQSLVGLAIGVVLLDLGAQANHVSNQTRIFALDEAARNRLNGVYMVSFFVGGASGSYLGAAVFGRWGFPGVAATGALIASLGLIGLFASRRR